MIKDVIKKFLDDNGYNIIKWEKGFVTYKDANNYKYRKYFRKVDSFKKNVTNHKFDSKNPYAIYNINNSLKTDNPFNTRLVNFDRASNSTFQCGLCGKNFEDSIYNLLKYKYKVCGECTHKIQKTKITPKNIAFNEIESYGYKLLTDKFCGVHSKIDVEDKEGYKGKIKLSKIRKGETFCRYGKNNPYTLENLKLFCKKQGWECHIPNQKFLGWDYPLKMVCECGNKFETTVSHLIYDNKFRCNKCNNITSKNEYKVEKFLDSLNICYEREKRFKDCYYKKELPFDFYLSDYNVLIEVQGEQHYKPTRFNGVSKKASEKNFKEVQKRDSIKEKYCETHDITLIKIPFYKFKDNEYKEIILNQITVR